MDVVVVDDDDDDVAAAVDFANNPIFDLATHAAMPIRFHRVWDRGVENCEYVPHVDDIDEGVSFHKVV